VRRFGSRIAEATGNKPVLDIGCGSGRNAVALAQLGCAVICVDKDLSTLRSHQAELRDSSLSTALGQLILHELDLLTDRWPFTACAAGAIINVHCLFPALFPSFESSLSPAGYLLLETVPGHGGNYLELPKAGELRSALETGFELEYYKEGKVGPCGSDAVTVQMLAKKRNAMPKRK
jgi:SAM-dependent methyltransferase